VAVNYKFIVLVLGLAAFPAINFAQGAKPGGGAGTGAPASGSGVAPADPSKLLNMNRDFDTMNKTGRKGDYLAGGVLLEGASLPWDSIPVSVTCDGKVRYTTATDPKGYFVIAPVEPPGSTTLKADAKPVATQFLGCSVDAALPGFNANPLPIANRNISDSPNIGTIMLRREEGSGAAAISSTSASAPKDATKAFDKARNEWLDKKPDRAQRDLQKAVEVYPQYAEAWYQLGKIQEASNSPEAWNSFSKAVAADPKFAFPYEHLASLAAQGANWQEVLNAANHALELAPRGTIQVWYYHALGNFQFQKMDVAETSAKKSLSMDPLHIQPNTEQLLAVILSQKGDTAGALEHLHNCLTYFAPGPNLELVKQQIAQLEPAASPTK
jgi:tetratricopeptide (TPR) repeat protein